MTNYEAMRRMSKEQMTTALYAFVLPFIEGYDEEHKKEMYNKIAKMLNSEVGK